MADLFEPVPTNTGEPGKSVSQAYAAGRLRALAAKFEAKAAQIQVLTTRLTLQWCAEQAYAMAEAEEAKS